MNRKGQISGETVAIAVVVILIVIGAMIWIGANESGPFYWLRTLMPNFDKPVASEIALTGLIKYDVSANPVLQYYDGVNFQNFEVKNGEQVLVIGGKAFKYKDVLGGFTLYYLNDNPAENTRTAPSDFLTSRNEPIRSMNICGYPICISPDNRQNDLKPGDVSFNIQSAIGSSDVKLNPDEYILKTDGSLYQFNEKKGVYLPVTNPSDKYYVDIINYVIGWRDSVISGPIKLNLYDYKNAIVSSSCKEYSFPVSKVKSLQGNGFVLTANLAKGTLIGECKGNVA